MKIDTRNKLEKVILNALVNKKNSRETGLTEFTENNFKNKEHRRVFKEILQCDSLGDDFDALLIAGNLVETYPLCIEYLARDDNEYNYEAIKWSQYFEKFKEAIKKDKIKDGVKKVNSQIKEGIKSEDIVSTLLETAESVQKNDNQEKNVKYLHEDNSDYYDELQDRINAEEKIAGIKTGYKSIDFYLSGLNEGNLITIAGRTTMGKSTLALQIAYNVAKQGIPVLYFHQEASPQEVKDRLIAANKEIDINALKRAVLNKNEIKKVKDFLGEEIPLILDYSSGITIEHIIKTIRRTKVKEPELKVVVIDHLQFMQYPKGMSNNDALDYITKKFLACIKKEKLVGIQLSQMNRSADKEDRPPKLSDLRDSGSIEQNSHTVLFIERALRDNPKRKMLKNEGKLYVAKNRNGVVGEFVKMIFSEKFVRYDEVKKEGR